jgi:hypothetical protein
MAAWRLSTCHITGNTLQCAMADWRLSTCKVTGSHTVVYMQLHLHVLGAKMSRQRVRPQAPCWPSDVAVMLPLQAWQFRQLEFLSRLVSRVEDLETRLDQSSPISTAPATAQLCTDKLDGLTVGLDEGMAALGSIVASCSRLSDAVDALSQPRAAQ